MIWSISWKNVWRNKKRSLVVMGAVTLGTIAGVFTAGLMKGWVQQRLDAVIHTETSHMELHNPNYLLNEEITYTLPEIEKVEAFLQSKPEIIGYTKRIKMMAMAGTSRGNTSLMLQGINLEQEKSVTNIYQKIVPNGGSYFDTDMNNPILISDKTAELLRIKNYTIDESVIDSLHVLEVPSGVTKKLQALSGIRIKTEKLFKKELKNTLTKKEINSYGVSIVNTAKHYRLRSKIVFTYNDAKGQLAYQTYKVCGIFKTSNTMFDQMNAYVLRDDLVTVAGFADNGYHEIAMIVEEDTDLQALQNEIKTKFPNLSAMTWRDISAEAAMMNDFMGIWYALIMGIILAALSFGIMNTMLMAILERTKEIGMLMAIGMNKRRVFKMIMIETVFLTLTGAFAGMGIGALGLLIMNHTGLNFSSVGEGFEAMGWSAIVYPQLDAPMFIMVTVMVVITAILSSISPARKALKMNPVEAIRTD